MALAPALGRQLDAAMKDEDRNRIAEAAGILLGLIAWAGGDLAVLKRFGDAMGSSYTFEHVLDSAQYFARLDEASPHLKNAALQLARAQRSWDSATSPGAQSADIKTEVDASTQSAPASLERSTWPQLETFPNVAFNVNDAIQAARAMIGKHMDDARPAGIDAGVVGLFIPLMHKCPHLHIGSDFMILKKADGKKIDLCRGGELKGNNVHRAREYLRESGKDPEYLKHMEALLDDWLIKVAG